MSYKTPITEAQIEANFKQAAEQYAAYGVDVEQAVDRALGVPISLHCWQGDDVAGFEVVDEAVEGGGIMATGNYPGRARDGEELRQDLKKVVDFPELPAQVRLALEYFLISVMQLMLKGW